MDSDSGIRTEQVAEHGWLISLSGEHDINTTPRLEASIGEAFAAGSVIAVDLTDTTFIESTTVGALVAAREHADHDRHDDLVVIAPPGTTSRRVLDLVGADTLFRIYDDRDSAITAITERSFD
jgi:anti-anti-sigma factor